MSEMRKKNMPVLYDGIRVLHLLLTSSLVPLSLWHLIGAIGITGYFPLIACWVVGTIVNVLIVTMDQARYPVSTGEAILRTAPLVGTLAVALSTGISVPGSALLAVSALVGGLSLALVAAIGFESTRAKRGRDELRPAFLIFLGAATASSIGLAFLLPIAWSGVAGKPIAETVAVWATWILHTGSAAVAYLSLLSYPGRMNPHTPSSIEYHARWGGPTAACFALSFLSSLVVVFWRAASLGP